MASHDKVQEVEDAPKIRRSMIDCLRPNISEEFAAELHAFLVGDLVELYPVILESVKITIIKSGVHILSM